jgi:hypothetical protein
MYLLLFLACTSSKDSSTVDSDTVADSSTDSQTSGDTDASDDTINTLRSLTDCGGSVADGVPEPYASWFLCSNLSLKEGNLSVYMNDLPPHASPYYPTTSPNWEAFDSRDGSWHQNPNTLEKKDLLFDIPLNPTPKNIVITTEMVNGSGGDSPDEYHETVQGMGLDGTSLFTGTAAPGDDIYTEEYTFDLNEGHPAPGGEYHHHGANPSALAVLQQVGVVTTTVPGDAEVELFGVMCDGTVVLGCTELDGSKPDTSDLDAQNGHVRDLKGPSGETWFTGRYHVHACAALGRTLTPEIQYYDDGTCVPPVR